MYRNGWACVALLVFSMGAAAVEAPKIDLNGVNKPLVELEQLPEIVARVDDHNITRVDLVRELVASGAESVVYRLAMRMAVEQAAAKAGITVTADELDAQVKTDKNRLYNEARLSPTQIGAQLDFDQFVRNEFQMTLEEYKNSIARERLLTRKLLGQEIRASEADLRAFFVSNPKLFQPTARYHAAHILITPLNPNDQFRGNAFKTPMGQLAEKKATMQRRKDMNIQVKDDDMGALDQQWDSTRQRAQQCKSELDSRKISWEQAVPRYSQDPHDLATPRDYKFNGQAANGKTIRNMMNLKIPGELGWYTENGPMVKEFYEGTKNLQPGQIGGPFRTQFGWHVVKMLDVEKLPARNFDSCRAEVEQAYFDLLLIVKSEEWLKQLQQSSEVEFTMERLWPTDDVSLKADCPVGVVNGMPVNRLAVWKELLRTDGPAALSHLVNQELALGPLKRMGSQRLEWETMPPNRRSTIPPPALPVRITAQDLDVALTDDRLRLDRENTEIKRANPQAQLKTLDRYVFENYGRSIEDYKRVTESALVLQRSVESMVKTGPERRKILLMDFYGSETARSYYTDPEWFEVAHIFWEVKKGSGAEVRQNAHKMAEVFKKQLIKGGNWDELSASNEDPFTKDENGVIGELRPGNLRYPGLYLAIQQAKLETGQFAVVESKLGVHLVQLRQKHKERVPEFSEIKDRVERDYMIARANLLIDIWLRAMKGAAKVEQFIYEEPQLDDNFKLPEK